MTRSSAWLPIAALLCFAFSATQANATAARTFLSGNGTDSGACPRATPCRTLAYAILQTTGGGEIYMLDSAGYGAVTITKAISIVNDGNTAGVAGPAAGGAITINAGPNDKIHLRGLSLDGTGTASYGILFNAGLSLDIANCVVRNFVGTGIRIEPATASPATSSFSVSNTIASDNGLDGIAVKPHTAASVKGVISNVATNRDGNIGIYVEGDSTSGTTAVTIVNTVAMGNTDGIDTATATILLGRSTITQNSGDGVSIANGVVYSYGDNEINDNGGSNVAGAALNHTIANQ